MFNRHCCHFKTHKRIRSDRLSLFMHFWEIYECTNFMEEAYRTQKPWYWKLVDVSPRENLVSGWNGKFIQSNAYDRIGNDKSFVVTSCGGEDITVAAMCRFYIRVSTQSQFYEGKRNRKKKGEERETFSDRSWLVENLLLSCTLRLEQMLWWRHLAPCA